MTFEFWRQNIKISRCKVLSWLKNGFNPIPFHFSSAPLIPWEDRKWIHDSRITNNIPPQIEIGAELLSLPSPLFGSLLSEGRMRWWVGSNVLFPPPSTQTFLLTASCSSAVIETEPFLTQVNYPTPNLKPTMSSIQSWKESEWWESFHHAQHFFQCQNSLLLLLFSPTWDLLH